MHHIFKMVKFWICGNLYIRLVLVQIIYSTTAHPFLKKYLHSRQAYYNISRKLYYHTGMSKVVIRRYFIHASWVSGLQSQSPFLQTSTNTIRVYKMLTYHGSISFIQSVITYKKSICNKAFTWILTHHLWQEFRKHQMAWHTWTCQ